MLFVQPLPETSGVAVAGTEGTVAVGVRAINRLPVPCTANVTVEARNSTGPMGEGPGGFDVWTVCATSANTTFGPWESLALLCSVDPALGAGWLVMRSVFSGSDCWTANDTGPQVCAIFRRL